MRTWAYVIGLIAILVAGGSLADIYKSVDANGVVTFSDAPPADKRQSAELIPTPSLLNGMQPIVIPPAEGAAAESGTDAVATREISIAAPSNNATIPMGAGIFDVSVSISSPLVEGEQVALFMDEEPIGGPQTELNWTLSYVIRGEHLLQAHLLSETGELLAESEPVIVYVLRPSIL